MTLTRDKLVERIAKALVREAGNDPDELCYGRQGDAAPSLPRWLALQPAARAILADLESAGLCIVPREPTREMRVAWAVETQTQAAQGDDLTHERAVTGHWRAMIAAAGEATTGYFIPDDGVFIEADGTVRRIKPGEG